jgi:periplasmic divalent cation tolerance protein
MHEIIIFYVPCSTKEEANSLADALLEEKLVACSNSFPIESSFWWEGQIDRQKEHVVLFKTMINLEHKVEEFLLKKHSYDIPAIIRYRAKVNQSYFNWIQGETRS